MTVKGGPKIETDGLVFHLDAASSSIGKGYSTEGLRVEYLVVGGGGGGGGWSTAGGGGAGGFLSGDTRLAAGTYTVTVGAGGTRGDNSSSRTGTTGGNSQLGNSLVAYGGGGGGSISNLNGLNGGSGGGGVSANTANTGAGGTGVSGQGNNGGLSTPSWRSAGGGGAGGAGSNGWDWYRPARGGIGKISKLDFVWTYYAGGGTSGGCTYAGLNYSGALGGGGSGGMTNSDGGNGGTNLGGGGGGGGCYNTRATFGGHGGSGIVMIRYWGKQKATGGDTIQYKNGYTIHTFTSSGSFVLTDSIDGTSRNKIVGELVNMGSINYNSGNRGYWTFDGTNECIDLNNNFSSVVGVSLPSTWSAFVYLNATNNNEAIIGSAWTSGGVLFRKTGSPHTPANRIRFIYFTNGSNGTGFDSASTFTSGWYHFVATYNGSGLSYGNFNFFANGIQQSITNPTFGTPTTVPNRDFSIGGVLTDDTAYWSGKISTVSVYNRVLSDLEILDLYNATKGRFGL